MFVWREVVRIICYLKQTAVRPQFWRSPHCCPTRPWPVWFYRTGTRRTGVAHLEKQSTISLFLVFAKKKKVFTRIHSPKWAKHQFKLSRLSCMRNACETKDFSTIVKRVLISKPERDGATCTKMYLSVYFDEGNQLL